MDRLSWFFKELVTQADLNTWEDNQEAADHSVVADILGFGFLVGAVNVATVVQNAVPDLNVKANRLLGYDQIGQRLSNLRSGFEGGVNKGAPPPQLLDMSVDELAAPTTVAGVGNEKTLSIFVKFTRNAYTLRTDGNNAPVEFNQDESVQFNVVQSAEALVGASVPPPLRTDQILLADVKLVHSQTAIVNANIDQSRRQAFALLLPHGNSHVSTGSDPIPGATGSVGGLMSAADKAKLDLITSPFSAWIGAQLVFYFLPHTPANITAPSAATLDVTSRLNAFPAGGSAAKEGIVTQTGNPNNLVILYDTNNSEIKSAAGNRIYGRVTVDNEAVPTAWTLSFFTEIASVETAYDFTGQPLAGATLQWQVTRSFRLDHVPSAAFSQWLFNRNRAVAAPAVQAEKGGAGLTNAQPIINFIQGANVTMTVTEVPGSNRIDVTIASSAAGGFPGFGSATNPDTVGGAAGGSGLAADAGHSHTLSSQYALAVQSGAIQNFTVAHPRIAVGVAEMTAGDVMSVGVATPGGQASWATGGGGRLYTASTFFCKSGGPNVTFTTFANGSQNMSGAANQSFVAVLGMTGQ